MQIKPLDIQQQQFRGRWFGGYDAREVEAFLELVAHEFEDILNQNAVFKEDLRRKENTLAEFREKEEMLKQTMITAQKISEGIKVNAQKESELIVSEAQLRAQELMNSAQLRSLEIMEEIKELKRQKFEFEATLRAAIETHLKMLDADRERREGSPGGEDNLKVMRKPLPRAGTGE